MIRSSLGRQSPVDNATSVEMTNGATGLARRDRCLNGKRVGALCRCSSAMRQTVVSDG
jgi:hypothetical protein